METKRLLIILLIFAGFIVNAENYYVSSTGNDSNTGLSDAQAWATLTKVNAATYIAGDSILFKSGDSWFGTLIPPSNGNSTNRIVFGAYGTGAKPKIYGSKAITGWTLHSGNIYKATVDETDITQLFLDDERMLLARYPDAGYHNTTNVLSSTTITSTDLDGGISYTGATWIGRTYLYTMYAKTVTGSSSQTITLNSAPGNSVGVGKGFFLSNKLEFLTQAGEWYYDNAANTLYLWTPNGDSPSGYEVRASTVDYGVNITDKSYIKIENLEIAQSATTGVYLSNGDYITIDNCDITSPDMFGVHAPTSASTNLTVTNTYIYQANSSGIRSYSPSAVLTGNTIEDTGLLENLNKRTIEYPQDNFGTGIFQRESNSIIQYNNIINSGYCGINFFGANTMVKYNFIDGACQTLDDGGGIYTYNKSIPTASGGSEIMYNIVKGVHGTTVGYYSTYGMGHGIYMDDNTANITIRYNTVFNSHSGYFSHINSNILFQYNTSFDNLIGLLTVSENANSYFYDNLVYSTNRNGASTWWSSSYQRSSVQSAATAVYDRNTYIHHYNITPFRPGATQINFASWKSTTGQDASSTMDASTFTTEKDTIIANPSLAIKKIYRNDAVIYNYAGTLITADSVTIPNYGSMIIVASNQTNLNLLTGNPEPDQGSPALTVTKSASLSSFSSIGELITFTITVKNTGDVTIYDITVNDALLNLNENITSLTAGQEETFIEVYEITQSDINSGIVVNTATAVGYYADESVSSNYSNTLTLIQAPIPQQTPNTAIGANGKPIGKNNRAIGIYKTN